VTSESRVHNYGAAALGEARTKQIRIWRRVIRKPDQWAIIK
jgi:hypothetical protein